MPVKVKKEKLKQKQKQSQKQIVNIKIGETKKQVKRRRVGKATKPLIQQTVQPVQYLYQASGSIPQPFKSMGVGAEPKRSILGGNFLQQPLSAEVQQELQETERAVRRADIQLGKTEDALQMGRATKARPNILGGGFFPSEEIARQRVLRLDTPLRLSQPEEVSLYGDFPNAELINVDNPLRAGIEEEVNIETLQPINDEENLQPVIEEENLLGGGAVQEARRRRTYRNRGTLIREIIEATDFYKLEELNDMNTMAIRRIHDKIFK